LHIPKTIQKVSFCFVVFSLEIWHKRTILTTKYHHKFFSNLQKMRLLNIMLLQFYSLETLSTYSFSFLPMNLNVTSVTDFSWQKRS
jgi:hypothetical protein